MTEFSVFMPLQGKAPGNSWIGGSFFEGLRSYMENKNKENENKIILEDFNCTGMVNIKHKDFIGAASVMPCQNSWWIMGLRNYGKGRTQITLSSATTSFFIKNTKNNHPPASDWWEYTKYRFKREC